MKEIPIMIGPNGKLPFHKYFNDAGYDMYVSEDASIEPNKIIDVHTDIYINIPPGMYGRITGRSSTLRTHNLLVNEGIIDSGYTGELFICVKNLNDFVFEIKKGMRLAQIIFGEVPKLCLKEYESLSITQYDRGSNGFGSTGR